MRLSQKLGIVGIFTVTTVFVADRVGETTALSGHHVATTAQGEDGDRRECPGPWLAIPQKAQQAPGGPVYTKLTVPDMISTVPEFHDCQRFIRSNGSYGARFAIFASFKLDTLFVQRTLRTVVGAEIFTPLGSWPSLGIQPRFNCLYLSSEDNWKYAYMLSVGDDEAACGKPLASKTGPNVTKLAVDRYRLNAFADKDYPPVSRWDRGSDGTYFIGIKCGDAWCTVGPQGATFPPPPIIGAMEGPVAERRVRQIKGWYDEQILALPAAAGLKPSTVNAAVVPSHRLEQVTEAEFAGRWMPVATIDLPQDMSVYWTKLGLKRGRNTISMRGIRGERWWAALIVTQDGQKSYRRVERWDHTGGGFRIPGTVRWRWHPNDETVWARCLEGCCQVQDKAIEPPPGG